MRKLTSVLLVIADLLLAGWCSLVALSFSGVQPMGFIGTGGREAGPRFAGAVGFTIVGLVIGWLIYRGGRPLERVPQSSKE